MNRIFRVYETHRPLQLIIEDGKEGGGRGKKYVKFLTVCTRVFIKIVVLFTDNNSSFGL